MNIIRKPLNSKKYMIEALKVIYEDLKDEDVIERQLAASLFVLNDQVQGNMAGAKEKGIEVPVEFSDEIYPQINDLLYAIFEDWDDE